MPKHVHSLSLFELVKIFKKIQTVTGGGGGLYDVFFGQLTTNEGEGAALRDSNPEMKLDAHGFSRALTWKMKEMMSRLWDAQCLSTPNWLNCFIAGSKNPHIKFSEAHVQKVVNLFAATFHVRRRFIDSMLHKNRNKKSFTYKPWIFLRTKCLYLRRFSY